MSNELTNITTMPIVVNNKILMKTEIRVGNGKFSELTRRFHSYITSTDQPSRI